MLHRLVEKAKKELFTNLIIANKEGQVLAIN
jgi:hypothetical protein